MILMLKLGSFLCVLRSLNWEQLDLWRGVKNLISVNIAIGLLPALSIDDFEAYMRLGYGQDA